MYHQNQNTPAQADYWLHRLTLCSLGAAGLALLVLLWAKWGLVIAMSRDVLKYCF